MRESVPEETPQKQEVQTFVQQSVGEYSPFDPARSANAGEEALAEVESPGSLHDEFFDMEARKWRYPAIVKGGLLVRRQKLQQELQGLEPGEERKKLLTEIQELNERIDRRTRGALKDEKLRVAFHNSDKAFGRAVPDMEVSTTDGIEANGGKRADYSHVYPERQDFIAAELDEKLEGSEKSGYYEFAYKLDQLYGILAKQKETNEEVLRSLHNIEFTFKAIQQFYQAMEQARRLYE